MVTPFLTGLTDQQTTTAPLQRVYQMFPTSAQQPTSPFYENVFNNSNINMLLHADVRSERWTEDNCKVQLHTLINP